MVITEEIQGLFRKWKSLMGAPVLEVEITDQQLCDLLAMAIEDYASEVGLWLTEQNWANFYGKNLSNIDLAYALSVRTLDMSKDYSYWFSKDVGLQQRGPWELKKDSFTIEAGKQDYLIPSGREVNRVMWMNPPTTQAAVYMQTAGTIGTDFAYGYTGGFGGGIGGAYVGMPFYFAQAMDIAYTATDLQYKSRMLNGDLWYTVTAGPEGTHIVHLYGNPRRFSFGGWVGLAPGQIALDGCYVTYTYYDVTNDDADECRRAHADDLILTPDQVPLGKMEYSNLNEPTKTIVRDRFFGYACTALANVRGKYSGEINVIEATARMDYSLIREQGREFLENSKKSLMERLERMSPYYILQKQAELADSMGKIISGKPMKMIVV